MTREILRVLIDDQIFRKQVVGGISNYFLALLEEFRKNSKIAVKLGLFFFKTERLSEYAGMTVGKYSGKFWVFPAKIFNSLKMVATRYDIVHSTFYSRWSIALFIKRIHIVTIHDMIPEDFPEYFYRGNPNRFKDKYIKDADGIITVSEYTFNRLRYHYPTLTCPITVIPLASRFSLSANDDIDLKSKFDRKTMLYVGPRGSHKNFDVAVESLSRLIPKIPNISLICAGGGAFTSEELRSFSLLGVESRIIQLECRDSDLRNLYLSTSLYLCPSIAEGFGLPSVEAASMLCPVIVGKNSFLGERLSDSQILFDVRDSEEMATKIFMALSNYHNYEIAINSTFNCVSDLSWSNTAEKTFDFYISITDKSKKVKPYRNSFLSTEKS